MINVIKKYSFLGVVVLSSGQLAAMERKGPGAVARRVNNLLSAQPRSWSNMLDIPCTMPVYNLNHELSETVDLIIPKCTKLQSSSFGINRTEADPYERAYIKINDIEKMLEKKLKISVNSSPTANALAVCAEETFDGKKIFTGLIRRDIKNLIAVRKKSSSAESLMIESERSKEKELFYTEEGTLCAVIGSVKEINALKAKWYGQKQG